VFFDVLRVVIGFLVVGCVFKVVVIVCLVCGDFVLVYVEGGGGVCCGFGCGIFFMYGVGGGGRRFFVLGVGCWVLEGCFVWGGVGSKLGSAMEQRHLKNLAASKTFAKKSARFCYLGQTVEQMKVLMLKSEPAKRKNIG